MGQEIRSILIERFSKRIWILQVILTFAVGYGITMTWIASELVHENNQLVYDLNVSQTAFMIQRSQYRLLNEQIAAGLCLPKLEGFTK